MQKHKGLVLGALGVVYGDIGTSPLYTLREVLHTPGMDGQLFGALSMMVWALICSVTLKYIWIMLRADNKGEGGIMALLALTLRQSGQARIKSVLIFLGIFGAALFYGDCVITPAISVLSAVEGLSLVTPIFDPYVVPISVIILVILFAIQKGGTAKMGKLFGPVMMVWFLTLGAMGLWQILQAPQILWALSPHFALSFVIQNPMVSFFVMGAVVLAITGGEALYSDMGHFGMSPMRKAWFRLVLPSLALCYLGQGALLLNHPEAIENPFFNLVPQILMIPLVILATAATIIASQAVISGAYSLTRQAMQLGYWPRLHIHHTSESEEGQIYIRSINWGLCFAVAIALIGFGSSSALAGAYGVAVTGNMVITSILGFAIALGLWKWPIWKAGLIFGFFLVLDLAFFGSNLLKIPQGGWFPLVLGILTLCMMMAWFNGKKAVLEAQQQASMPMSAFLRTVQLMQENRVQGTAVFLCGGFDTVPHALMHNLYHNKVLHQRIFLIKVYTEDSPHIPRAERVIVKELGSGFWGLTVRYGYMDSMNLISVLRSLGDPGLKFKLMESSFFVTHQTVLPDPNGSWVLKIQMRLFAIMLRNAPSLTSFFRLPHNRVIEVGSQIEI